MTEDLINAAQRVGASREMAEQVVADGPPPAVLEIVIGVARAMGQLDAEAAHKYLTADFVDHEASPGVGTGPEGYLATARYMHQAFPDAAWQPEDFFTAGDKYAVRVALDALPVTSWTLVAARAWPSITTVCGVVTAAGSWHNGARTRPTVVTSAAPS